MTMTTIGGSPEWVEKGAPTEGRPYNQMLAIHLEIGQYSRRSVSLISLSARCPRLPKPDNSAPSTIRDSFFLNVRH